MAWRSSVAARAPQGQAEGKLSSSANGTHQQKPGKVRTCDEQHDSDGEKQCAQHGTHFRNSVFLKRLHDGPNTQATHKSWIVAHGLFGHALCLALRLLRRDAGFQPSHHSHMP
jgi:hypothetical protein